MEKPLQILLIEDSPLFVELARAMLAEAKSEAFHVEEADHLANGIQRLNDNGIDAVLLDLTLPDSEGLDTFVQLHRAQPDVPVVIITSLDDEEVSLEALRLGAADYLVKGEVTSNWLAKSITHAIQRSDRDKSETDEGQEQDLQLEQSLVIRKNPDQEGSWVATFHQARLVNIVMLEEMKERLSRRLHDPRCEQLLLDFSEVEYVSNGAISMLLRLRKHARTDEAELRLTGVSTAVYEQFSSRHFDKVFTIDLDGQRDG